MPTDRYQQESSASTVATQRDVTALLSQVVISQATELARSGRYEDAERALGMIAGSASGLDLRARIRAQQGRLVEAQALWGEAARLDPTNESVRLALQRLALMNRRPAWMRAGIALAALAAALLLVVLLVSWQRNWWRQERSSLVAELRPSGSGVQPIKPPPAIQLDVPGTTLRNQGKDAVLRFDSGLFVHGDKLTSDGKSILMEVGEQLKSVKGNLAVCVVGHSDSLPLSRSSRFKNNRALALARADIAADVISSRANLFPGELSIWASEGSIYPNDSSDNRARNRTVEIRITQMLQ